jgi:hypothetical protein
MKKITSLLSTLSLVFLISNQTTFSRPQATKPRSSTCQRLSSNSVCHRLSSIFWCRKHCCKKRELTNEDKATAKTTIKRATIFYKGDYDPGFQQSNEKLIKVIEAQVNKLQNQEISNLFGELFANRNPQADLAGLYRLSNAFKTDKCMRKEILATVHTHETEHHKREKAAQKFAQAIETLPDFAAFSLPPAPSHPTQPTSKPASIMSQSSMCQKFASLPRPKICCPKNCCKKRELTSADKEVAKLTIKNATTRYVGDYDYKEVAKLTIKTATTRYVGDYDPNFQKTNQALIRIIKAQVDKLKDEEISNSFNALFADNDPQAELAGLYRLSHVFKTDKKTRRKILATERTPENVHQKREKAAIRFAQAIEALK